MRSRRPLPQSILTPSNKKKAVAIPPQTGGITLGDDVSWNPTTLPNGHIVLIGAIW